MYMLHIYAVCIYMVYVCVCMCLYILYKPENIQMINSKVMAVPGSMLGGWKQVM